MPDQAPAENPQWSVPVERAAYRLDAFARYCLPHLSRRQLDHALREKLFLVNGRVGKKGDRLKRGDVITFAGPEDWLADRPAPEERQLTIAYEDETLLIVDKPAGVPTHGFSGRDRHTLANFLLARQPGLARVGKNRWEPGLVHRLDRDTSGLLVVAKTQSAFNILRRQFRQRQVKKKYWALVSGRLPGEGTISCAIAHDPRDKSRMRALVGVSTPRRSERAWSALTRFRKRGEARGLSLLEVEIETGVTHQIRVHLAAIGHPIVGDTLYGTAETERFGLQRHFLHASYLEFAHPRNGQLLTVESELPAELAALLRRLRIPRAAERTVEEMSGGRFHRYRG